LALVRLALLVIVSLSIGQPALASGVAGGASPGGASDLATICDPAHGPSLQARFAGIGAVSLFDGTYDMEITDLGYGTAMATTFTRAYLSADTRTTLFGVGWMNNFQVRLRKDDTRDLLFTLPNGNVERFKGALDNDRTTGTSRGYRVLAREELGRFLRVYDEDITWTFGPGGTLERVDDASGDWVAVAYDAHAHLAATTGPAGPGLLFEIGPNERITRVTMASDPTDFVRYEYDAAGRLIRAVHSSGFGQRFAYDGDSQLITEISDDEGTVLLVLEYDDGYSVFRERDGQGLVDGEAVTYEFEELPDGGVRSTAIYPPSLVEPTWHPVQRALHDSQGRLLELELQPTSDETLIGKYAYDSENRRIVLEDPCPRELVNPFEAMLNALWQLILLLLGITRL